MAAVPRRRGPPPLLLPPPPLLLLLQLLLAAAALRGAAAARRAPLPGAAGALGVGRRTPGRSGEGMGSEGTEGDRDGVPPSRRVSSPCEAAAAALSARYAAGAERFNPSDGDGDGGTALDAWLQKHGVLLSMCTPQGNPPTECSNEAMGHVSASWVGAAPGLPPFPVVSETDGRAVRKGEVAAGLCTDRKS